MLQANKKMTVNEVLNKFKEVFPTAKIDDYRPICHELFSNGEAGITIWLENGDILEYYPKMSGEEELTCDEIFSKFEGKWITDKFGEVRCSECN